MTNPPIPSTPESGTNAAPAEVFTHLRNLVFQTPPEVLGLFQTEQCPLVWGAMMELGYPAAVVTLISMADGTTSLVFTSGSGMIGGGRHNAVADASRAFVERAGLFVARMSPTEEFPLPEMGRARFYVLTFEGVFTADAGVIALEKEGHALTPLYFSGQEVITQLRLIGEEKL